MKNLRIQIGFLVAILLGVVLLLWSFRRNSESTARVTSKTISATVSNPSAEVQPGQRDNSSGPGEEKKGGRNDSAELVAKMLEWGKITDASAADKIEIKLKDRITDANAEAIVRGLPPHLLETQFGLMALGRWATLDRKAVVKWIAANDKATPFQIITALHGWLESDTDGVNAYTNSLPTGPWKEKFLAEVSRDAVRNADPMEAITLLREMTPSPAQIDILKWACSVWAQGDPASAAAWANQVNEPALKTQLLGQVAVGRAYSDPQNAAEWSLKALPPGEELNNTVGNVVTVWAQESNPVAVAQWVGQLPEGSTRQSALKGLISQWRHSDSQAFTAWENGLPSGSLRQDVMNQLANVDTAGLLR